jgi:hypothetical protein
MKYAVEMGTGVMMYIPSFIKTASGLEKLKGDTHDKHIDHILVSLRLFFFSKEGT